MKDEKDYINFFAQEGKHCFVIVSHRWSWILSIRIRSITLS